jgi:hypothetical protein
LLFGLIAPHELTGFGGRCDAMLFCRDVKFNSPNKPAARKEIRRGTFRRGTQ